MTELSPRAQELQKQLLRRYFDSLPEKRTQLADAWAVVQASAWSADSLARLKTPVHRLAGSAGSYGLEEVGWAARALDASLKVSGTTPEQQDEIEQQLETLLAALADAQKKT
jgi:HPt (histidine-containing phosphotransfer) domain-containing protein